MPHSIGISTIAYQFPKTKKNLQELQQLQKLDSTIKQLKSMGFLYARIAEDESHYELAAQSIKKLFTKTKIAPSAIDMLVYAGALASSTNAKPVTDKNDLSVFAYTVSRLQYEFGMTKAMQMGVSQLGCVSFMNAIWHARNALFSEEEMQSILCVSSDVLPNTIKREIIYNVISDVSCSVLIEKNASSNKILSFAQIAKGYYWDSDARKNELIASYFPTAKLAIDKALKKANAKLSDISLLIPHNVSMRSWEILLKLIQFPKENFFGDNIRSKGHTIAADNLINLHDAIQKKRIKKGELALLFTFGFGANWSAMIIEH